MTEYQVFCLLICFEIVHMIYCSSVLFINCHLKSGNTACKIVQLDGLLLLFIIPHVRLLFLLLPCREYEVRTIRPFTGKQFYFNIAITDITCSWIWIRWIIRVMSSVGNYERKGNQNYQTSLIKSERIIIHDQRTDLLNKIMSMIFMYYHNILYFRYSL